MGTPRCANNPEAVYFRANYSKVNFPGLTNTHAGTQEQICAPSSRWLLLPASGPCSIHRDIAPCSSGTACCQGRLYNQSLGRAKVPYPGSREQLAPAPWLQGQKIFISSPKPCGQGNLGWGILICQPDPRSSRASGGREESPCSGPTTTELMLGDKDHRIGVWNSLLLWQGNIDRACLSSRQVSGAGSNFPHLTT